MLPNPPPPLPLIPPEREPDYANLGQLNANGRWVGTVVLVLLSPLVVDFFAIVGVAGINSIFLAVLLMGAMAAKFVLMALWLAWGGSRLIVRLVVVGLSLAITSLFGGPGSVANIWPLLMLAQLLTATLIAVPRLFGSRWVMLTPDMLGQIPPRSARAGQFSLFDIFLWTTTIAVLLGVFRWVELPGEYFQYVWLLLAIYAGLGGLTTLLYLWAMLGPEGTVFPRFWVAWFVTLVLGIFLGVLTGDGEATFYIAMFAVSYATISLGCMAVLRANGARFLWRERNF